MMGKYVTTESAAGIYSIDGGCIGYVMAPSPVSDSGGPNELDPRRMAEEGRCCCWSTLSLKRSISFGFLLAFEWMRLPPPSPIPPCGDSEECSGSIQDHRYLLLLIPASTVSAGRRE